VHFGIKFLKGNSAPNSRSGRLVRWLDALLKTYRPETLAVKEAFYTQARSCPALRRLIGELKRWGGGNGLRLACHPPTVVKSRFCAGKRTRQELAEAMVRHHWFLYHYLRSPRTQAYWRQMFDAVALGTFVSAGIAATPGKMTGLSACSGKSLQRPR